MSRCLAMVLSSVSLMICDVEQLFMYGLAIWIFSSKKYLFRSFAHLKVGLSFWHYNEQVPYTLWIVNPYQIFSLKYYFLFHNQASLFFWSLLLLCQSLLVWCKQEWGFPWWLSGEEFAYRCRKWGFNPWVRKTPWRRKWQPIQIVLPGKLHGPRNPVKTPEEAGRL